MSDHREVVVWVFVAAIGESAKSPEQIGLPPVHVEASLDAAPLARPCARRHGSEVRTPQPFQAVDCERGRTDWASLDLAPERRPDDGADPPKGIGIRDGRIRVALPPGMTRAGFSERRHAALRHLRGQDVASGMAYLPRRFDEETGCRTFSGRAGHELVGAFRGGAIVADPCALESGEPPRGSFRMMTPARSAAAAAAGSHP